MRLSDQDERAIRGQFYDLRDYGTPVLEAIKAVSAEFGISGRRVAAICDLAPNFAAEHLSA